MGIELDVPAFDHANLYEIVKGGHGFPDSLDRVPRRPCRERSRQRVIVKVIPPCERAHQSPRFEGSAARRRMACAFRIAKSA
jgi:hypothetical protein